MNSVFVCYIVPFQNTMRAVKFAVCSPIAKLIYVWLGIIALIAIPVTVYRVSLDMYMTTHLPDGHPECANRYNPRECNASKMALAYAVASPFVLLVLGWAVFAIVWTCEKCIGCHVDAIRATRLQWIDENAKKNE